MATNELKVIKGMDLLNKSKTIFYCQRAGLISIAGLLFILPFHNTGIIRDSLFATTLLSFLTIIILKHSNGLQSYTLPNKSLNILIIVSLVWGMITLFNAIDPKQSFSTLIHKMARQYIFYFLAYYFVSGISSHRDKLRWVLFPLSLAVLIMSIYACYQFYQAPILVDTRVSSFTGEIYRFAVFLVLSFPILLVLIFHFKGLLRGTLVLGVVFFIAALFFTFTRSAWIAVIVEISVFIIIFLKKYKNILLLGMAGIVIIFIMLSYHSFISEKLINHGEFKGLLDRVEAFSLSWDIIVKNPIMGIGYGKGSFSKFYTDVADIKHSHNLFLNTAVEMGIIGLIIFLLIMANIIRTFKNAIMRERKLDDKLLISGIFVSIIGFLSLNLFDYMYQGWPGQMLWILIGIGYALVHKRELSFDGEAQ